MLNHKIVYSSLILITLLTVLNGCSRGDAGVVREQPGEPKSEQVKKTGENKKEPDKEPEDTKDIGVIIDTVTDVFREPDVQSERVTQTIFNQPVKVIGSKENWLQVKVVDGYSGWVKSKFVEMDASSVKSPDYKFKLIVTSKVKSIYNQVKGGAALKDIVMGCELMVIDKVDNWYRVALPGKSSGWVNESGTILIPVEEHIPKTSASDFVNTALKLKGTVYLWGGVSTKGIDCSGLTYICSRINGVDLPRDADMQFAMGEAVEKDVDLMKQGDLVFFSTHEDLKDISHVGIYSGNGQFIHATKSKGSVVIGNIKDDYFKKRLVGVKRIFQN